MTVDEPINHQSLNFMNMDHKDCLKRNPDLTKV